MRDSVRLGGRVLVLLPSVEILRELFVSSSRCLSFNYRDKGMNTRRGLDCC